MLGLQASNRIEMMENIIENCSYLIQTFGFVPNASRTYFLGRSQPPYFSLMLDLLFETTQNETINGVFKMVADKESGIRNNSVMRTTSSLQKVFGVLDSK